MKQRVASHWEGAVLVCAKCSRRVGGGFGPKGKTRLAKLLRKQPGFGTGRKARIGVVESRCLGVCPRDAVTLVDTRRPADWLLVRPGTAVEAVIARLDEGGDQPA